jgi:hypothetical protein
VNYTYKFYKPIGFYNHIIYENETQFYVFINKVENINYVYCMNSIISNKEKKELALLRFKKWAYEHPEYAI